ncbi:MAG: YfhO family protein, partial [Huintestinicola sp.]
MEENNIMPDNKDITPAADGNIPDEQNPKQNEDTIGAAEAVAVAEAVAMAQQASGAGDKSDGMAVKKVNVSIIDGGRDGSGTGKKKTAPILKFIKGHKNYIFVFFLAAIILFAAYAVFGVHPFGDMSVLVLDLNGQYVYYFENLRDILHGDGSPFISWSRNLSGEIMGMFAYYLASPFTLIPMVLPRSWMTESLLIMQLCKVGTAAVTFYYYLKHSQNCRSSTCMIFSLLYSLMGYMIVQLMNPMWLDGLIYLPLIIYGIEKIIDENSWLRFIIPLALMFMAHFYIGWMIVFFSIIYFIYYYFAGKRDFTFSFKSFFFAGIKFATGGVIAACTAGWVLLPLYYSLSLGKFEFSTPSYTVKTQFELLDFFKNLLPNVYDTCRPEGSPIVYCGVITLILVPLFFLNSKVRFRQKMGLGAVLASVLLSMYLSTADLAWHGFQVPNWLPYRYSFTFSFVLLVMAAIAFERLEGISLKDLGVTCAAIAVYAFTISTKEIKGVDLVLSIWYCVLFVLVYGIFLRFIKISKKNIRAVLTYVMAIFIVGELFGSSLATMTAINKDVVYSKYSSYNRYISLGRETVKQLYGLDSFDDNGGVYRVEKNHHRTVNDPMAFGTFGISHSSSTLNAAPIQFLRKLGFSYGGHYIKYKGSTYVTDALLGIKYVMEKGDTPPAPDPEAETQANIGADNGDGTSLDEETQKPEDLLPTNKHYSELVLTNSDEKDTWAVYKNPYALPVAFMADSSILDVTLDKDNPFVNQNELLSHLISDEYTEYFKQIFVSSTVPENARQSSYGTHTKYT